jgi:hypothetical protein
VMGTVHQATETVEETLSTVKTSINDTVASVKRNLDVNYQVRQHPWLMVGGCTILGFAVGHIVRQTLGRSQPRPASRLERVTHGRPQPARIETAVERTPPPPAAAGPSLLEKFQPEINQLKGLAVGYLMGQVRDSIKQSVPQYAEQIDNVIDRFTTRLGGEVVPESTVASEAQPRPGDQNG